jgi:hypothetical protein
MSQSNAVASVLKALAALNFGEHETALADYRASAARVIQDEAKRIELHQQRLKNPTGVALLVVLDQVGNDLSSGRYNVGPGKLSSQGAALVPAFADIVRQLRETKTINEVEAVQAIQNLHDTLAAAG